MYGPVGAEALDQRREELLREADSERLKRALQAALGATRIVGPFRKHFRTTKNAG